MPNQITSAGLETKTQAELIAELTTAFQGIYGPDIDLSSNSPDGQLMRIFIQVILDNLDLLTQIYNSFDPDRAIGTTLDSRVAYNGIQRLGGSHTVTNITIVTTQALTLKGVDGFPDDPYTVSDNAGNQFQLLETQNPGGPGTFVYAFQAAAPGAVLTTPNTINTAVTIVLGVASINNPSTYTTLGVNEETDAVLKVRRQRSVAIASQGYRAALLALLENLDGVTDAFIYENITDEENSDGVPAHSIWVIVGGSALDSEIADAIYRKRNAGCGMFGETSFVITQSDGSPFVILWDEVENEDLYIKFTASSLDGINNPNIELILEQLPLLMTPGVFEQVNVNELACLVQEIDSNCLVTNAGFSLSSAGPFTETLTPSTKKNKFAITAANIIIIPIILSPETVTMVSGGATQQFTPLGGFAPYTYLMLSGPGSINGSGLYTSATVGTAVVKVTDSLGNIATSTITVVAP